MTMRKKMDFSIAYDKVILLDCGHVCACADCAAELLRMNQGCPVCRFPPVLCSSTWLIDIHIKYSLFRSPIERVGAAYIS